MILDIYKFDKERIQSRKKAAAELEELQNSMLIKINQWYKHQKLSQVFREADIEGYDNSLNTIYQTYPKADYQILNIWFQNFKHSLRSDELSGVVYGMPINEFVESIP